MPENFPAQRRLLAFHIVETVGGACAMQLQGKPVDAAGGSVLSIGDLSADPVGGSWGRAGEILIGQGGGPILRVPATGGTLTPATRLDASAQQVALAWLLQRSPTIALIPGTSSVAHLHENVAAASLELPPDALGLTGQLDDVADGLTGVLDELREIARGLHPAILADGGLRPALKALARRSAVPVRLDVRLDGRLPDPVELAAYYVIAEALTNTAKHAAATTINVQVAPDAGTLRIRVHDDGRGGADPTGGTGLLGLTDRVEALGGHLSLHSPPGAGTTMHVTLPLTAPTRAG